jgi:hypothetical protein
MVVSIDGIKKASRFVGFDKLSLTGNVDFVSSTLPVRLSLSKPTKREAFSTRTASYRTVYCESAGAAAPVRPTTPRTTMVYLRPRFRV